jgi:hypothetical protein
METVKIQVCDLESCAITILLKDLRTFISLLGVLAKCSSEQHSLRSIVVDINETHVLLCVCRQIKVK